MKLDPYLTPCKKMNSKLIIDLKLIARAIEVLEENTGVNLCGPSNSFLDMTPKALVIKEKINWNSSNIKTFVFPRMPSRK